MNKKVRFHFHFILSYYFIFCFPLSAILYQVGFLSPKQQCHIQLAYHVSTLQLFSAKPSTACSPRTELYSFSCQWTYRSPFADRFTAHKSWECIRNFWSHTLWHCFLIPPVQNLIKIRPVVIKWWHKGTFMPQLYDHWPNFDNILIFVKFIKI